MAVDVSLTKGVAAGAFDFTSNVAANNTVTIGHITYTFVASPSSAYDVDIGSDLDESIENLASAINADGTSGAYGAGTLQHPLFSAVADTANDELDLTARMPGVHVNGQVLGATSPGGNDISANGATFAAVAGGTDGAGSVEEFIVSLLRLNQINAEVQVHLKELTDDVD